MVVGASSAKVQAAEGLLSPVFATGDCAALRLVQGEARAVWIGSDGRPGSSALTAQAAPAGLPTGLDSGLVQRVVRQLGSQGATVKAGHKRFDEEVAGGDVHVPAAGLALPVRMSGDATLTLVSLPAGVMTGRWGVAAGQRPLIPSVALVAARRYRAELSSSEGRQRWELQVLAADDQREVSSALAAADAMLANTLAERAAARALVYEQQGLSLNRDAELALLK